MTGSRLIDRGYTPSIRDVDELLTIVDEGSDEEAEAAERAVLRIEKRHAEARAKKAIARAKGAKRPGRGRLTRLVGRLGTKESIAFLIEALADDDIKTRRNAARALGKTAPDEAIEKALVAAWDRAQHDDDRRVIGEALGKVGGKEARARLEGHAALVKANVMLDRAAARERRAKIDLARSAKRDLLVRFHCREGLEAILADELGKKFRATIASPGVVEGRLAAPLADVAAIRTAVDFGFPIAKHGEEADAIVDAVTSKDALAIFRAFTDVEAGAPIRFRVALPERRRALLWRIADLVRQRTKELVNDPRDSTWEVRVDRRSIELVPRAFEDPRFSYRAATVAASSHPTIAAAIARVAPLRDDDVVWDPFVGAGAELVERAKRGHYKKLIGTDIDPKAIEAARTNLARAGITDVTLEVQDATTFAPEGVTAILTNPPMGRRVHRGSHRDLLSRFAKHAASVLVKGGTLVWTVPEPRIRAVAVEAGLALTRSWKVDMGGFPADLSVHTCIASRGDPTWRAK